MIARHHSETEYSDFLLGKFSVYCYRCQSRWGFSHPLCTCSQSGTSSHGHRCPRLQQTFTGMGGTRLMLGLRAGQFPRALPAPETELRRRQRELHWVRNPPDELIFHHCLHANITAHFLPGCCYPHTHANARPCLLSEDVLGIFFSPS